MSKIGKINISIPEKVKVDLAGNILNIEGPLGKKTLNIDLEMFNLDIKDGKEISIVPKKIDDDIQDNKGDDDELDEEDDIKIGIDGETSTHRSALNINKANVKKTKRIDIWYLGSDGGGYTPNFKHDEIKKQGASDLNGLQGLPPCATKRDPASLDAKVS